MKRKNKKSVSCGSHQLGPGPAQDEQGRFIKGNRLGASQIKLKTQKKVATLIALAQDAITDAEMTKVIKAMLKEAKKGDVRAATWCRDTRFGKLKEIVSVEHVEPLFAAADRIADLIDQA